jgi:hypothetical protein
VANLVDLRGRTSFPVAAPVLADPSGRRARVLAGVGRAVGAVFLLWLLGLLLAGLGMLPSGAIPLGPALRAQSLPALKSFPRPAAPSKSDLAAAKPLSAKSATALGRTLGGAAATTGAHDVDTGSRGGAGLGHGHGGSGTVQLGGIHGGAGAAATASGTGTQTGTSSATTRRTTTPGRTVSQSSPGHTRTTSGNSGSAPGQTKKTTTTTSTATATTSGQSGSAPGHTRTHGSVGGNRY